MGGAVTYGVAFVGFSAIALYTLVTGLEELDLVFEDFGALYTVHVALLVAGGLLFGASVLYARVFPRWTGVTLIAGVLLSVAIAAAGLPDGARTLATAVRSVAFAGMGLASVRFGRARRRESAAAT